MKLRVIKVMLTALAALLLVTCATAPKKTTELPDFLIQARNSADEARAKAVEIKASVAAKEAFNEAEVGYEAAKDLEAAADYEKSATGYTGSAELYAKAYDQALILRENAVKAMGTADEERIAAEEAISKAANEQAETGE